MKTPTRWILDAADWLLVLAVAGALMLFAGCAHTPQLEDAMQTLAIESEGWAGVTACGTKPRSWIADDMLDGDAVRLLGLRAHEAAHRKTASEFPTCDEYIVWLRDPINRLRAEAFAYCVQAHVEYEAGGHASIGDAFVSAARLLRSPAYPSWPLTTETAAELIALSCTKAAP